MDVKRALIEGITQDLILFIVEDSDISIEEAMAKVYNSIVFEKLSDFQTGLYRESSAYVYELLKDEWAEGRFVQKEF
jgi:hypothetical protein